MPLKKPLPLLVPQRMRTIPQSFAWIDHRLRSEGFLPRLRPEDLGLYLFLALAADQRGLSCWRLDRVQKSLPCFDHHTLWDARSRLVDLDLIAYRPWNRGEPGRLLPSPLRRASPRRRSPELKQLMSKVFQRLEAPSIQTIDIAIRRGTPRAISLKSALH